MVKNWYAVITAEVLYSKKITARQKLLYAAITNMSNNKGYCFATNAHFAEMFSCSTSTVKRDLTALEEKGFINRVIKVNSKGVIEYRALTPLEKSHQHKDDEKLNEGVGSRLNWGRRMDDLGGGGMDDPYNNKDYNNKDNKLSFDNFWNLYNKKTGKPKCLAKWSKLTPQEQTSIIDHVPKYVKATPDKKYRKNPLTYLNNRCWEDEDLPTTNQEDDYIEKNRSFAKSAKQYGLS